MIRERAAELEGQLEKVYCDLTPSGKQISWQERDGFRALTDAIGPGDHLIVWRLDRIAEDPFETVEALRWLTDRGVWIHVLEFGEWRLDLDRSLGQVVTRLLAGFLDLYANPSSRQRNGFYWRSEQGLAVSNVGLGKRRIYKMVRDPERPHPATKREGFDEWDPADCDIIREIWRRHALEGETLYSVARDLKARDLRRWDGRPWVPDGCCRQSGSGKRYPLNPRNIQRVFWRYVAMLAVGQDLQDLPANPQHAELARDRIRSQRQGWTRTGQPGRLPKEVRGAIEQNNLEGLAEITPKSWSQRAYPGSGQ